MNAEEFTARLNALLDARRDWENDPQLQLAALESTECRELLDAYLRVFDGFEQISSVDPSPDLTRRIVIQVRAGMAAEARQTLPIAGNARWRFTAAAALVACAVPLAWYFSSDRPLLGESAARRHHSLDATVTEVATLAQAPTHHMGHHVGQREAEGVKALVGLARETQEAMGEVVLQLPAAPAASPAALVPPDSTTGRLLRSANVMEHVSEGLAPLANSAAGALDFLLEVLPHRDD